MNLRMLSMLAATALVFGGVFGFKWFGNRMMNQYFDNMPVLVSQGYTITPPKK